MKLSVNFYILHVSKLGLGPGNQYPLEDQKKEGEFLQGKVASLSRVVGMLVFST